MTSEEQYKALKKIFQRFVVATSMSIRANTKPSKEIGSISESAKEVMEEFYIRSSDTWWSV